MSAMDGGSDGMVEGPRKMMTAAGFPDVAGGLSEGTKALMR